jgi:aminopeptidase N
MTLHALRARIGEAAFSTLLRRWARVQAGGLVTTREFVRLAERISGRNLDRLFDTWLYSAGRPDLPPALTRLHDAGVEPSDGRAAVRLKALLRSTG